MTFVQLADFYEYALESSDVRNPLLEPFQARHTLLGAKRSYLHFGHFEKIDIEDFGYFQIDKYTELLNV